jgi:hypothetical protein
MKTIDLCSRVLAFALLNSWCWGAPVSREDFVKAMAKIKEGMPEKEVLAILGQPDDIRTPYDSRDLDPQWNKECWGYGTDRHLSFPTLGCVFFDSNGKVRDAFGGPRKTGYNDINGTASAPAPNATRTAPAPDGSAPYIYVYGGLDQPPSHLFSEEQLRGLLRVIDTTPGYRSDPYDILALIRVVNALQPLGKEKALAAIDEYLRVSDDYSEGARLGLFLVLRVLFDVPEDTGVMPAMSEGYWWPKLPRSPIVIERDIPLFLYGGFNLMGAHERVEEHVEYFRKHGHIRSKPLMPTDDPLSVLDDVMNSWRSTYKDKHGPTDRDRVLLMEQLLRLIDSVYRLPTDKEGQRLMTHLGVRRSQQEIEVLWKKYVSEVSRLKIRWDPRQNLYVLNDGSHLPPLPIKQYRRAIWKLEGLGVEAELILERLDETWVFCNLNWEQPKGATLKQATLVLYDNLNQSELLETFDITNSVGSNDWSAPSIGGRFRLKEGNEASAQLIFEKSTNFSPVFKP